MIANIENNIEDLQNNLMTVIKDVQLQTENILIDIVK